MRNELEHAEDQLRQARRDVEARERAAAARAAFEDAFTTAQAALQAGQSVRDVRTIDDLVRALEGAERSALAAVDDLRQALAVVAGRLEAITSAAAELDGASGDCPVCRRPLSGEDVEHARRSHDRDLATLDSDRAARQAGLARASEHLDAVRSALRQALAVPRPGDLPAAGNIDVDAARVAVEGVRARYDDASGEVAGARAMHAALEERIAAERAAATNGKCPC